MFESPTPEERPFVEAVCAAPADLSRRLVFADWLEEQGDPRGAHLRDSVALEQAIERLGWGFAFAHWRAALPYVGDDPEFTALLERVRRIPLPQRRELPLKLRQRIVRHYYFGGFLENVGVNSRGLRDDGEYLRATIPLRGILAGEIPRSMGGLDILEHEPSTWRGIERLVLPGHVADSESDFAPFATAERALRFAELAVDLDALAVDAPEYYDWSPCFAYLNRSSLRSLVIAARFVPFYGPGGLLENWTPIDLRCLGLPFADVTDSALVRLADWEGLRNLRLLEMSNVMPGERAWKALERSLYRRDDFVVMHAGERWRSHGTQPIRQVLVEKGAGDVPQQQAAFFDFGAF